MAKQPEHLPFENSSIGCSFKAAIVKSGFTAAQIRTMAGIFEREMKTTIAAAAQHGTWTVHGAVMHDQDLMHAPRRTRVVNAKIYPPGSSVSQLSASSLLLTSSPKSDS